MSETTPKKSRKKAAEQPAAEAAQAAEEIAAAEAAAPETEQAEEAQTPEELADEVIQVKEGVITPPEDEVLTSLAKEAPAIRPLGRRPGHEASAFGRVRPDMR